MGECAMTVMPISLRLIRAARLGLRAARLGVRVDLLDVGSNFLVGIAAAQLVGTIDLLTQGREFGLLLRCQRTALGWHAKRHFLAAAGGLLSSSPESSPSSVSKSLASRKSRYTDAKRT